jgi:hypothetical protein
MKRDRIVSVLGAEALQDLRDVVFDAVRRDAQVLRDLFVREAGDEKFDDILLAGRESARIPRPSKASPSGAARVASFHRAVSLTRRLATFPSRYLRFSFDI